MAIEVDARTKLEQVLEGIELTQAEVKTLDWITSWEEETTKNLVSILEKVVRIRT